MGFTLNLQLKGGCMDLNKFFGKLDYNCLLNEVSQIKGKVIVWN